MDDSTSRTSSLSPEVDSTSVFSHSINNSRLDRDIEPQPGFPHWYMPLPLLLKIRLSHSSSATIFRVELCEIHVVTTSTCPPSMQTNRLECLCARSSPLLVSQASHASGKPPGLWPKPIMHTSQRCDWLMRALAILRKPSWIKPW
jgi:hypothetical protein